MKAREFMGLPPREPLNPKEMTDQEIAQLRFTAFELPPEEEKAIIKELDRRKKIRGQNK